MDKAVGQVVTALKKSDMLANTVIVFMSDNGGPVNTGASNYPLRGSKGSLWEGGTRTPAFITGHNLGARIEERMFHITDWVPTLLDMVGVRYQRKGLDGVSHWDSLAANNSHWGREDMLYNVVTRSKGAMRVGDWKLILPNRLYNIRKDERENKNIARTNQDMVNMIKERIGKYTKDISRVKYPPKKAKGHARNWNGTWTYGWC